MSPARCTWRHCCSYTRTPSLPTAFQTLEDFADDVQDYTRYVRQKLPPGTVAVVECARADDELVHIGGTQATESSPRARTPRDVMAHTTTRMRTQTAASALALPNLWANSCARCTGTVQ